MAKRGRPKKKAGVYVVIDIGTGTIYLIVRYADGSLAVMKDPWGACPTLAAIGFEEGDPEKLLIGLAAENYRLLHAERVATMNKRARGLGDVPMIIDAHGNPWSSEALEVKMVAPLLAHVEAVTGQPILSVMATVPNASAQAFREATAAIVERAGYKSVGTINESTGAALHVLAARPDLQRILIVDIGKGTTDVTALAHPDTETFEVLCSRGREDLGGREFTMALVQLCIDEMDRQGVEFRSEDNLRDFLMLTKACEEAKRSLSGQSKAHITWQTGGRLFQLEVTRDQYAAACAPLWAAMRDLVDEVLAASGKTPDDFDGVACVGGQSYDPMAAEMLSEVFGNAKVLKVDDPDQAIARGAALGIGMVIKEAIAAGDKKLAIGAPSYVLECESTLKERIGWDIGVRAVFRASGEEKFVCLIPKDTPIPCEATEYFGLEEGAHLPINNTSIEMLQGDSREPADKACLVEKFPLKGLPPDDDPHRIEITIGINANAVAHFRAYDKVSEEDIEGEVDLSKVVMPEEA